jgi:hypothetical protein
VWWILAHVVCVDLPSMDDHVDALMSGPQLETVSLAAGMINSIDMVGWKEASCVIMP